MSDQFEHNPGDHEDPLSGPTWIVGFLGAVLLTVIILGITAVFYNAQQHEEVRKVVNRDPEELQKLRSAQVAQLHEPPRLMEVMEKNDKGDEKLVEALVIPIDQAMKAVVNEAKSVPGAVTKPGG
jgi:hypothetical protein